MTTELILIRHGETQWSLKGRHTGLTDVELTQTGITQAHEIKKALKGMQIDQVFTSPLMRAQKTCQLAGLLDRASINDDLLEWNYGNLEGKTTLEIRKDDPDWVIFNDGAPGGEKPKDIKARADRFIEHIREKLHGRTVVFTSGHISRAIGARWIGAKIKRAANLDLSTASISILGFAREIPVIKSWNGTSHLSVVRGH